jgi:hypothetical protein
VPQADDGGGAGILGWAGRAAAGIDLAEAATRPARRDIGDAAIGDIDILQGDEPRCVDGRGGGVELDLDIADDVEWLLQRPC